MDPSQTLPLENIDIRVSFKLGEGHYSYIGTDSASVAPSKYTMNLDPPEINLASLNEDRFQRVVLHQFGHALGFTHEHLQLGPRIDWDLESLHNYYNGHSHFWSDEEVQTQHY